MQGAKGGPGEKGFQGPKGWEVSHAVFINPYYVSFEGHNIVQKYSK